MCRWPTARRWTPPRGCATRRPTAKAAPSAPAGSATPATWACRRPVPQRLRRRRRGGRHDPHETRPSGRCRRVAWPGLWQSLSFQASHTDYHHQEVEGSGEVGTTFDSRGSDAACRGPPCAAGRRRRLEGVVGLQCESLRFSALGEEAFVPGTRSRNLGVFVLESIRLGDVELSGGLRDEQVRVASDGDARRGRRAALRPRAGAALQPRIGLAGCGLARGAGLAAERRPGPHRTGAGLLRALRQRPAPGHRRLRGGRHHVARRAQRARRGRPGLAARPAQAVAAGLQHDGDLNVRLVPLLEMEGGVVLMEGVHVGATVLATQR